MKAKYYCVHYRSKHNHRGRTYAVKGTTSKKAAIRRTFPEIWWRERPAYYAPIAYEITEAEFNENYTVWNKDKDDLRWSD